MFSIIDDVRQGNEMKVRMWLDNTENDPNTSDDHRFSLLHWAAKCGHLTIVDMLLEHGARINVSNMGDDTPLHLAAAHNCREIARTLLKAKATIDAANEHGNTPLHYSCFWNYQDLSEDLISAGASVVIENQDGNTPLEKARPRLRHFLEKHAQNLGIETSQRLSYQTNWSQSTMMRTRSRDPTLSRDSGVDLKQLRLQKQLCNTHNADIWIGFFKDTEVVVKVFRLSKWTQRHSRCFDEENPKLRIFNHVNILPVLASLNRPPTLMILSQRMNFGSLHDVVHHGGNSETTQPIVIDAKRSLLFALDIARGMDFLHTPELKVNGFHLNSKHVMIDEDMTAKLNMADNKFGFHQRREYNPAWMSPESLLKKPKEINRHAADIWSFGVILWELETRQVPFSDFGAMETGIQIATESLRIKYPLGMSRQKQTLIQICVNDSPGKRPKFDQILPILEKMRKGT